MNQRDYGRRSGNAGRDNNRRDERSGPDRRFSNERDYRESHAERRLADQTDRVNRDRQRSSHEYGWNNERNWNDERNDWERHDDGVRATPRDYGQERSRSYGGERVGSSRGYDQEDRTFRQNTSGGALPRASSPGERNEEQRGQAYREGPSGYAYDDGGERRGHGSGAEQGFGAAQYGYGPSGYGSSSSNSGYGNRGEHWQGSPGREGERRQGAREDRWQNERWQGGHGPGDERWEGSGGPNWGSQGSERWQRGGQLGGRGFHGVGSYFGGNHGSYDTPESNYDSDYGGPGAGQRGSQRMSGEGGVTQRSHRGVGPAGYSRSDERIKEDVSDALTDHDDIDASEIEVSVKNGEVTLSGSVDVRYMKRFAEDVAERVRGVRDVRNEIRVKPDSLRANTDSGQRASGAGVTQGASGTSGTSNAGTSNANANGRATS